MRAVSEVRQAVQLRVEDRHLPLRGGTPMVAACSNCGRSKTDLVRVRWGCLKSWLCLACLVKKGDSE